MRKTLVTTLGVASLLLFASFFNQSNIYYYAYNEKVELIPVDSKLVVRYKHNKRRNIANISQNQIFAKHGIEWRDDSTMVITTTNKSEKVDLIDNLRKHTEVYTCNSVYRVNGGGEMEITDEFVVRFKDFITRAQVDSMHKRNRVTVIRNDKIY